MAFVLALNGRGFAEIGTRGLRAEEVVRTDGEQQVALDGQMEINKNTKENLKRLEFALENVLLRLEAQERRQNIPKMERLP